MLVFPIIRLKKVVKPLNDVPEDEVIVGDDPVQIKQKIRSLEQQIRHAKGRLAMKRQEGGFIAIRKARDELIHLEYELDMYLEKLGEAEEMVA